MAEDFNADDLQHGWFTFTKPHSTWGRIVWYGAIILLLVGFGLMVKASGIPDVPPISEAEIVISPDENYELEELGKGFDSGQKGAWLRMEGQITEGVIAEGHCTSAEIPEDITRGADYGDIIIQPMSNGELDNNYDTYDVRWSQEMVFWKQRFNAENRGCSILSPGDWTINHGTVQLFVLDDGESLWIYSAGEDNLEPPEVHDREDIQRLASLFLIIGSALMMFETPTSLEGAILKAKKKDLRMGQRHVLPSGLLACAAAPHRALYYDSSRPDQSDWIIDEPSYELWNLENPYAEDKDGKVIDEHPTITGTPHPAVLTFYSIAAMVCVCTTIWLSNDLLARQGTWLHEIVGNILRWGVLAFNIVWVILSLRTWKINHNILDTPTQLVRSTAVGPAELVGQIRPGSGGSMSVNIDGEERTAQGIVAYEWTKEESINNGNWWKTDSGKGSIPFILHDGSAGITIDPSTWKKIDYGIPYHTWHHREHKQIMWTLRTLSLGDPVYCLGRAEAKKDGEFEGELDATEQSSLLVMRGNADIGMSVKLQRGTEFSMLSGMRSAAERVVIPIVLLILSIFPFF